MTQNTDPYSSFWTDWMLAVDGIKGKTQVPRHILKRWEKEVADWYDKHKEDDAV